MPSQPSIRTEIIARMRADDAHDDVIHSFLQNYERLVDGEKGVIPEDSIQPVESLPDLAVAAAGEPAGRAALSRTVVIQLNGGLGTSMGLDKAKSLLPVRPGVTFLDLIAAQVLHIRHETGVGLPLLLMNSPATHDDTLQALARYPGLAAGQQGIPLSFLQHRVPRIDKATGRPVTWPDNPELEWCPPGHGDIYLALVTSGILRHLLDAGYRYAFVSNADNLGASLDLGILGYFAGHHLPFLMEVTERTEADRKGGHLARQRHGGLVLRELAQCPPAEADQFQDIRKHRYFNTNNLWVDLQAISDRLEAHQHFMGLPLIVNQKPVDPRDPASPAVYQLETAMGSAIALFAEAEALAVPRTRFAPVKTTADLLVLWSDIYELTPEHLVVMHPGRNGRPPRVELDPEYYRLLDDFTERFPGGAPSLRACERLTVEGDIRFGSNVRLAGIVHLRNPSGRPVRLDDVHIEGTRTFT
jgi:UTP--glucose-1-phosphate uridylyltransferase